MQANSNEKLHYCNIGNYSGVQINHKLGQLHILKENSEKVEKKNRKFQTVLWLSSAAERDKSISSRCC